jgi:hypothetical protein
MFDLAPPPAISQQPAPPRVLALQFVAGSGTRLVLAATRRGCEEGAALAHALKDMILDSTVDPLHWPLDDMIVLLRRPARDPDAQVERLIGQLERIRHRIGHWVSEA